MKYRMTKDSDLCRKAKAGTAVYSFAGYDYGLANDDTRDTGVEHISVTLREDGGIPSFTVPITDIEEWRTIELKPGETFELLPAPSLTAMVAEFHRAFRLPGHPGQPTLADSLGRRQLRRQLLWEEFEEYMLAEATNDIVEVADALGDMAYIIWGTALEYGIPLDEVIAEIHRSNMSKLDALGEPLMRKDGKVLKSERFTPPNIEAILRGGK